MHAAWYLGRQMCARIPDACDELTKNGGSCRALAGARRAEPLISLASSVMTHVRPIISTRKKGTATGISGHHITWASPEDDLYAEDSQLCFLQTATQSLAGIKRYRAGEHQPVV